MKMRRWAFGNPATKELDGGAINAREKPIAPAGLRVVEITDDSLKAAPPRLLRLNAPGDGVERKTAGEIEAAYTLPAARRAKIEEIKAEALRRIAMQVPEWDTFARVAFVASIWNLLGAAKATPAQKTAKDIYLYARDTAIPAVMALSTLVDIGAADVANDPGWPS